MREFDNRDIFWKVMVPTRENTELLRESIDYVIKKYPPPLKVLDVGAKEGYSTNYWKTRGYDVLGTDIRSNFINYAKRRKWNVIFDDMTDTKLTGKYDLVLMRHVLEHVKHDHKMFGNALSLLKEGGIIVVQVPIERKGQFELHTRKKHLTYFPTFKSFALSFLSYHKEEVETVQIDMASNLGIDTAGEKDIFYIGKKK